MNGCEYCGGPTKRINQKFCSVACYGISRRTLIGTIKICAMCNTEFEPSYKDQMCCSDKCAKAKADETKRGQAGQIGDVVKACARCGNEYRQRLYKTQQIYCEDCIAFKDRDKCRRRRAKLKGVEATARINDHDIYERDNWTCKLCNQPIDRSATWPEAESASIDHIVPLSKGGAHTLNNVQSAHLGCNMVKGNRVEDRQTAKANSIKRISGQSRQTTIESVGAQAAY